METLKPAKQIVPKEEIYMRVLRSDPASLRVMQKCDAYIHHEDDTYMLTREKKETIAEREHA